MPLGESFASAYNRSKLLLRNANLAYHKSRFDGYYEPGLAILDADWDNLLLMDACRYDMFLSQSNLPGKLSRQQSRGTMTAQFLAANFDRKDATDVVYVTANPMLRRIASDHEFRFHKVIDVWEDSGWDSEHGTVLPETMVERTREAACEYPRKRLLIHFMQPHFPFIHSKTTFDKQIPDPDADDGTQFWDQLRRGNLSLPPEAVWEPYLRNLELLLPSLQTLLNELEGKTVVTSDHGNMVGDRSRPIPVTDWGHPRGLYTPELVDVPWLVHESGNRKDIVAEAPSESQARRADASTVRDRLRDLGYAE
jgi:hypothetical protein